MSEILYTTKVYDQKYATYNLHRCVKLTLYWKNLNIEIISHKEHFTENTVYIDLP